MALLHVTAQSGKIPGSQMQKIAKPLRADAFDKQDCQTRELRMEQYTVSHIARLANLDMN